MVLVRDGGKPSAVRDFYDLSWGLTLPPISAPARLFGNSSIPVVHPVNGYGGIRHLVRGDGVLPLVVRFFLLVTRCSADDRDGVGYACRAGPYSRYWSGDEEADLARVGWYGKGSKGRTHRVAEKLAKLWASTTITATCGSGL